MPPYSDRQFSPYVGAEGREKDDVGGAERTPKAGWGRGRELPFWAGKKVRGRSAQCVARLGGCGADEDRQTDRQTDSQTGNGPATVEDGHMWQDPAQAGPSMCSPDCAASLTLVGATFHGLEPTGPRQNARRICVSRIFHRLVCPVLVGGEGEALLR